MKKVKILTVILVLSLMLTGTAYALWSQNITVTTSAAMGEMNAELSCGNYVYPLSYMPGIAASWAGTYKDMEPYMNPLTGTVTADRQSFNVNVENMYPGAKYGVTFGVKNTGDVPFTLQGCTVQFTGGDWNLFKRMTGSFQFIHEKENGSYVMYTVPAASLADGNLGTAILKVFTDNNIVVYPGDQLVSWYDTQNNVRTFMQVSVDKGILADEFENTNTAFTVDFNWQQCDPIQYSFPAESTATAPAV